MLKKIRKTAVSLFFAMAMAVAMSVTAFASGAGPDPYAAEVTFENESVRGSVEITKFKENKKDVLQGVTFKLQSLDATIVQEKTTGADGKVLFSDLMPGRYTITETKTADGYTLLKDPIDVSIPYGVEEQKAKDDGLDVSKAVLYKGTYYYYDLKFEVADEATFVVPMTGFFDHWTNYLWLVAAFILMGGGAFFLIRKKNVV